MDEHEFGWEEDWIRRVSPLPDGLDEMAPGAELGAVLERIDRSVLNGHELVIVAKAAMRQISHLHASFYATVRELAYSTPTDHPHAPAGRRSHVDGYAGDELAAALTLTRRSADTHVGVALDLGDHPQVAALLSAGEIDVARARVICDETRHLEPDETATVTHTIVEEAPEMTTGQLRGRIRRLCTQADPDHARTRYKEGVEGRHLWTGQNPDGTGQLVAEGLPIDRLYNIRRLIEALADRLRGQDDRTIDQIRTDILMDLLEGNHNGITGRSLIDIRVDLTTLLGLDDQAAELPGWGPIIADLARQIVERQADGTWQLTVTDPDTGEPLHTTITRRRPNARQRRHLQAANPTCVFPGCRAPAVRSDIDHNRPYSQGGPTLTPNLAPLCPHHNQGKHKAGWKLVRLQPGTYQWTSPRGHKYLTRPPPH